MVEVEAVIFIGDKEHLKKLFYEGIRVKSCSVIDRAVSHLDVPLSLLIIQQLSVKNLGECNIGHWQQWFVYMFSLVGYIYLLSLFIHGFYWVMFGLFND